MNGGSKVDQLRAMRERNFEALIQRAQPREATVASTATKKKAVRKASAAKREPKESRAAVTVKLALRRPLTQRSGTQVLSAAASALQRGATLEAVLKSMDALGNGKSSNGSQAAE